MCGQGGELKDNTHAGFRAQLASLSLLFLLLVSLSLLLLPWRDFPRPSIAQYLRGHYLLNCTSIRIVHIAIDGGQYVSHSYGSKVRYSLLFFVFL